MEEKERYEYYFGTNSIKDNKTNKIYDYVVDLLNQQDKRIKEIEQEIQQLKQQLEEAENYIEEDEVSKREYYQKVDKNDRFKDKKIKELKQQLYDLPKKIVCEISEAIERLSWRKTIYTNWEFDKEQLYKDLDTILKKYGDI